MDEEVQNHIDYNFTIVKNDVIESHKFDKSIDKLVYITLLRYGFGKGKAFPSLKTIANDCLISSKSTLTSSLRRLVERKYISIERRKNEKGEYISNIYHLYDVQKVVEKMDYPSLKNGQRSLKNGHEEEVIKNNNLKGVKGRKNQFQKDIEKYKPVNDLINQKYIQLPLSVYQKLKEWVDETSTDKVLKSLTSHLEKTVLFAKRKNIRWPVPYAIELLRRDPEAKFLNKKTATSSRKAAEQEAIRRWLGEDEQAAGN